MNTGNAKMIILNGLGIVVVLGVLLYLFLRSDSGPEGDARSLELICHEASVGDPEQAGKWIEVFDTDDLDAGALAQLSIACMQVADRGGEEAMTARAVALYNRAMKADAARATDYYTRQAVGQEHLVEMLSTLAGNLANPVDVSVDHDIDPEAHQGVLTQ